MTFSIPQHFLWSFEWIQPYFAVGIVLSWNMTLNETPHSDIASYQLFAYQEGSSPPSTSLWKKVGICRCVSCLCLLILRERCFMKIMTSYCLDVFDMYILKVLAISGGRCQSLAFTNGLHSDTVSRREQISFCCSPCGCARAQ